MMQKTTSTKKPRLLFSSCALTLQNLKKRKIVRAGHITASLLIPRSALTLVALLRSMSSTHTTSCVLATSQNLMYLTEQRSSSDQRNVHCLSFPLRSMTRATSSHRATSKNLLARATGSVSSEHKRDERN